MPKARAAISLLFLAPLLSEVLSGSTSLSTFLSPGGLAIFVLLGYGLPILLIREYAVRKGLRPEGIFCLGLAFGFFNEGLLAKTIVVNHGLPIREFDGYAYYAGISIAWAITIAVWHALAAVLFPIVFAHRLFSSVARDNWLPSKATATLTVLILIVSFLAFMGKSRVPGTLPQALILFSAIGLCTWLGFRMMDRGDLARRKRGAPLGAILFGWSALISYVIISKTAAMRPPVLLFLMLVLSLVLGYWLSFRKLQWAGVMPLTLFAIGFYMQLTALGVFAHVVQGKGVVESLLVAAIAESILIVAAVRLRKSISSPEPVYA